MFVNKNILFVYNPCMFRAWVVGPTTHPIKTVCYFHVIKTVSGIPYK